MKPKHPVNPMIIPIISISNLKNINNYQYIRKYCYFKQQYTNNPNYIILLKMTLYVGY